MANTTDTQRTGNQMDSIVSFIDGKVYHASPFGDNKVGERAYKRAEKIASAIFLVTNPISELDSLRLRVRSLSMSLLDNVLALRDEMRAAQSDNMRRFQTTVRQLISSIRLLAVAGHISYPNADTICDALDELALFVLSSQKSMLAESFAFSGSDFFDSKINNLPQTNRAIVRTDVPVVNVASMQSVVATNHSISSHGKLSSRSPRSRAILEVLMSGTEMSIRDISAHLPEYSEKMIQRELFLLVSSGEIIKKGSKRWSRYSITQSDNGNQIASRMIDSNASVE